MVNLKGAKELLAVGFFMAFFLNDKVAQASESMVRLGAEDYQRAEQFLASNKDQFIRNDMISPNWIAGEDDFWYLRKAENGNKQFLRVDVSEGRKLAAFDQSFIAKELSRLTEQKVSAEALPFDSFSYNSKNSIDFQVAGESYQCTEVQCVKIDQPAPVVKPGEALSPDGKWAVYFKNNNLWIRATDGSEDYPLTQDGELDNTYGISTGTDLSPISRQRMRLVDAPLVVFSPDSSKLVTQRVDQRKVEQMHLIHHTPQDGSLRPKLYSVRYATALDQHKPMATFVLFDLNNRQRVDVDYPAIPVNFVPNVHPAFLGETQWQSDGEAFYFIHRYDFAKGYAINRVDANTGQVQKVASRTADATAFPAVTQTMPGLLYPVGSKDFVWYSDKTGWGHLYLTVNGKTMQLTQGDWNVIDIVRFDEDKGVIYFTRGRDETESNPYHVVLSSVRLDGNDFKDLTPDAGVHQISAKSFSPSGGYFVDNFSSAEQPGISNLRTSDGALAIELEKADISGLEKAGVILPETFKVTAADGRTAIWGKLLKPSNFDPEKSYPVIDSIYPGPQINRVSHSFSGGVSGGFFDGMNPHALAELGFIVVMMDGRGTPGRSRSFHYNTNKSLLGDAGGLVDHVVGIKELAKTRPWMDLGRVGIYGHSGGGYASTHALLVYPDFYKVAVSSAGNHEQRLYVPVWAESYLGKEEGSNYLLASNPHLAGNLQGKLLIVIGAMDDNVHPAQSYQLVDALIKANKDFDLLVLPNAAHGFVAFDKAENSYFTRRLWDYFVENLMGAKPPVGYQIGAAKEKQ